MIQFDDSNPYLKRILKKQHVDTKELNMVRLHQTNMSRKTMDHFQDLKSLIVRFSLPSQALQQEGYTHDVFLPAVVPAELTQGCRCAKGARFVELVWASCSSDTVPGTVHRNWLPGGDFFSKMNFACRDLSKKLKGSRLPMSDSFRLEFNDVAQFLLLWPSKCPANR